MNIVLMEDKAWRDMEIRPYSLRHMHQNLLFHKQIKQNVKTDLCPQQYEWMLKYFTTMATKDMLLIPCSVFFQAWLLDIWSQYFLLAVTVFQLGSKALCFPRRLQKMAMFLSPLKKRQAGSLALKIGYHCPAVLGASLWPNPIWAPS